MEGADALQTGSTAFRLGLGKVLVPFVFVFSPSLLLVVADFTWREFFIAFIGCAAGITCLGAVLSGFMLVRTRMWEQVLLALASLLPLAPEIYSSPLGAALISSLPLRQATPFRLAVPPEPVPGAAMCQS